MVLLEKLITTLKEGKRIPLKHSLLIVSGIEDKRIGNRYLKKFNKIKKNYHCFEKKKGYNLNNLQKAKILSEYLTNPIKYQENKFLFPEIINAKLSTNPFLKHGNCVGLTSLYNSLAEEEGIYTGIYKQRGHVLSRSIIFGKEYAIENTSSNGFNIKISPPLGKGSNMDLLAEILISRKFNNINQELEIINFAKILSPNTSLIYFNSAIVYYNTDKTKKALEEMDKAIEIDPFNPKQYKFRYQIKNSLKDKKGAKEDKRKFREFSKQPNN